MLARALEHPSRLRGRERDRFTERVDGIGRVRRGDRRNHLAAYVVDVRIAAVRKFRRQRMRGEQRRANVDGTFAGQVSRDFQLLKLGRYILTVAGLDLDRRHALGGQRRQTGAALREQQRERPCPRQAARIGGKQAQVAEDGA